MLGILPSVLVAYGVLLTGIRLKGYFGCSFLKTKFSVPTILDLVLGSFSFDVHEMAPAIAKQALYWMDSIFACK